MVKISIYDLVASIDIRRDQVYCKCGNYLYSVSNGLLDRVWICEKCFKVYQLELREVSQKKVSKEFLEQSKKELEKKGIIKRENEL